tara:strand:- start:146 stop:541 length:396 start_codon:yes stop_codon:yes gene_type:complete
MDTPAFSILLVLLFISLLLLSIVLSNKKTKLMFVEILSLTFMGSIVVGAIYLFISTDSTNKLIVLIIVGIFVLLFVLSYIHNRLSIFGARLSKAIDKKIDENKNLENRTKILALIIIFSGLAYIIFSFFTL